MFIIIVFSLGSYIFNVTSFRVRTSSPGYYYYYDCVIIGGVLRPLWLNRNSRLKKLNV